ncbi:MAG: DUF2959 domain-containing protein [Phycisphaeraceae bacterium]|nr:DUF2959 domain-containing protein [Phycisphaeraceae bacterium]
MRHPLSLCIACLALSAGLAACASTGIAINEAFGYAKREQLVDRVQDAKAGQEAAREQFADALEEFMALTGARGGDLERIYRRLDNQLDRCESRASTVRSRIDSVESVASALFREWERELDQYESQSLRAASEAQLIDTRAQYQSLLAAMQRAEGTMEPVLQAFRDQVLFLKHNLNARAVASLQNEVIAIEGEVQNLIAEMNASIAEATAFIDSMSGRG